MEQKTEASQAVDELMRADFEAWHRSKFATRHSTGQPTRDMHNGIYAEEYGPEHQQKMWEAWQASRAALKAQPAPTEAAQGAQPSGNSGELAQVEDSALRKEYHRAFSTSWMHGGKVGGSIPTFDQWKIDRARASAETDGVKP